MIDAVGQCVSDGVEEQMLERLIKHNQRMKSLADENQMLSADSVSKKLEQINLNQMSSSKRSDRSDFYSTVNRDYSHDNRPRT